MMNSHWDSFANELTWFLTDGKRVNVGELMAPGAWRASRKLASIFPSLSGLLSRACTSHVAIDDCQYILFSWEGANGVSSWLAPPPCPEPSSLLYPRRRTLLREFGGVTERANEPDGTWLLNSNESLTHEEASHDATFIVGHSAIDGIPGGIPIAIADYYSILQEANGN